MIAFGCDTVGFTAQPADNDGSDICGRESSTVESSACVAKGSHLRDWLVIHRATKSRNLLGLLLQQSGSMYIERTITPPNYYHDCV